VGEGVGLGLGSGGGGLGVDRSNAWSDGYPFFFLNTLLSFVLFSSFPFPKRVMYLPLFLSRCSTMLGEKGPLFLSKLTSLPFPPSKSTLSLLAGHPVFFLCSRFPVSPSLSSRGKGTALFLGISCDVYSFPPCSGPFPLHRAADSFLLLPSNDVFSSFLFRRKLRVSPVFLELDGASFSLPWSLFLCSHPPLFLSCRRFVKGERRVFSGRSSVFLDGPFFGNRLSSATPPLLR